MWRRELCLGPSEGASWDGSKDTLAPWGPEPRLGLGGGIGAVYGGGHRGGHPGASHSSDLQGVPWHLV